MAKKTHPDIKWIKIATNIFADEKILLIEQMPDADTILVIWFKLLCMAGKENNCGVFVMGGKIPYTEEMLATIFRRNLATVRLALKTFEAFGMIEIIEDPSGNEVYTIPNWEKHQNIDGMERIREQTRQRVAKHRENQRLAIGCNAENTELENDDGQMSGQCPNHVQIESKASPNESNTDCNVTSNATCNVTVTLRNATEEEEEEEEEEEKEEEEKEDKKKKNTKKKKAAPYVADDDLNQAILEFIEFRKQLKKPMTERAVQLMIAKLNKLSTNVEEQIEIVNQSILNGWQGIFPLSNSNNNNQSNRKPIREEVKPSWMKFQQNDYDFEALENDLQGIPANSPPDPDFEKRKAALESRLKEKYGKNKAAGI